MTPVLVLAIITTVLMGWSGVLAICRIKTPQDGIVTLIDVAILVGLPIWTVWALYAKIPA